MSAWITPAVRRASQGIGDATNTSGELWLDEAQMALDAALDVEEMARAFVAPSSWDELSEPVKNEYRIRMRHVRAAVLGES